MNLKNFLRKGKDTKKSREEILQELTDEHDKAEKMKDMKEMGRLEKLSGELLK